MLYQFELQFPGHINQLIVFFLLIFLQKGQTAFIKPNCRRLIDRVNIPFGIIAEMSYCPHRFAHASVLVEESHPSGLQFYLVGFPLGIPIAEKQCNRFPKRIKPFFFGHVYATFFGGLDSSHFRLLLRTLLRLCCLTFQSFPDRPMIPFHCTGKLN